MQICEYYKPKKAKMIIRFLPLLLFPLIGIAQTNTQVEMPISGNTVSEKQAVEIKRNTQYNLDEIKVRWKKTALENCAGTPCSAITAPGAPTSVVATGGNASASVAFEVPTNNGGRAITGYTVTSNPATSPAPGTSSPIIVTGLTNGTSYTFTVIATNEVGNSVSSSASTAVILFKCGTSTVSDYDGNPYNTVLIDNQCWTRENLKVTKYNDGTDIPNVTNGSAWATLNTGARAVYEVSGTPVSSYVGTYGYLYNWYAVNDSKKICPKGWHVPSTAEWSLSINYMGGFSVAGDNMKSTGDNVAGTGLWVPTNTGTDFYGFTAHPGGYRFQNGDFFNINRDAKFWHATENSVTSNANTLELDYRFPVAPTGFKSKVSGLSVRCLKDL